MSVSRAMFAAGCFREAEAAFRRLAGVLDTRVGYTGGGIAEPDHDSVMAGGTGHVQVVLVEFDPLRLAYRQLLDVFWSIHDPTLRHEPDSPYRSAVFYFDDHQRRAALASRRQQQTPGLHRGPIRTEIRPAGPFHPASEHHQRQRDKDGRKPGAGTGG